MWGTSKPGEHDEHRGDADHGPAAAPVVKRGAQQRRVDTLDERVVMLSAFIRVQLDAVDEERGHDRYDGQGADERGQKGKRHRQGEGKEELAYDAAHEADRQEHRHGRERGAGDGAGHLTRTRDDRLAHWIARPRWR